MAKVWGGAGAWAADAERVEEEQKVAIIPTEAFPTLGEAATSKTKKKKQHAMPLSELMTGKYVGPGGRSRSSNDDEILVLPTGPRDRSDEPEETGGLGGGFRDYGGRRGNDRDYGDRDRDRGFRSDREPRARSGFGFDQDRGDGDRERGDFGISRADEGDWGAKKFVPPSRGGFGGGGYDDDRRGGRISDRDMPSKADEVENWAAGKKVMPLDSGRRGYQDSFGMGSRADDVDNWGATKKYAPGGRQADDVDRWSRRDYDRRDLERRDYDSSRLPERPRIVLQPRTRPLDPNIPAGAIEKEGEVTTPSSVDVPKSTTKPNPFGNARPREEVLAEKAVDLRKFEADDMRPPSSHSSRSLSRPDTPDLYADAVAKPRPKVNPFGDAKPREVLLQEKGMDWRKIDFELEHRSVDRTETEEEIKLKEKIKALVEEAKKSRPENGVVPQEPLEAEENGLHDVDVQISEKQKELEQLIRALDDKVRFSQRGDRPSSRSGRSESGRSYDRSESGRSYEPPRNEARGPDIWVREGEKDRRWGRNERNDLDDRDKHTSNRSQPW